MRDAYEKKVRDIELPSKPKKTGKKQKARVIRLDELNEYGVPYMPLEGRLIYTTFDNFEELERVFNDTQAARPLTMSMRRSQVELLSKIKALEEGYSYLTAETGTVKEQVNDLFRENN
jgi:hypothetical protein